jgi:hypothetical protein
MTTVAQQGKTAGEEATWTLLVHGPSKTGKSWLLDTLPAPRLILDVEGRARFTPSSPKVYWDPKAGGPPKAGDWVTCVASIPDYDTLEAAFKWLRSGQHPFISVGVDSLMEAQKRAKDIIVPGIDSLRTQDWGELLRRLEKLVRDYRDLRLVPATGVKVIAFVTGTRETDSGLKEPLLEGAIRDAVSYYIDTVGYLYKAAREDGSFARGLLVDQQPGFIAGDGTNRIVAKHGPVVWDPNLTELFELMKEDQ